MTTRIQVVRECMEACFGYLWDYQQGPHPLNEEQRTMAKVT